MRPRSHNQQLAIFHQDATINTSHVMFLEATISTVLLNSTPRRDNLYSQHPTQRQYLATLDRVLTGQYQQLSTYTKSPQSATLNIYTEKPQSATFSIATNGHDHRLSTLHQQTTINSSQYYTEVPQLTTRNTARSRQHQQLSALLMV